MIQFKLNGKQQSFDGDPTMPLLWYVRDIAGLSGTKFGCGMGLCGACTVHRNGKAVRSCFIPDERRCRRRNRHHRSHRRSARPASRADAWIENSVPQCGYCQSGQIMQAVALLAETPKAHATRKSKTPWRETSAAAEPISAFAPPSSRLRG